MKKIAKLLNSHMSGKQTKESNKLLEKISSKLIEAGFKPPFKIRKKSGFNLSVVMFDLAQKVSEGRGDLKLLESLPEKTKERILEVAKKIKSGEVEHIEDLGPGDWIDAPKRKEEPWVTEEEEEEWFELPPRKQPTLI